MPLSFPPKITVLPVYLNTKKWKNHYAEISEWQEADINNCMFALFLYNFL